MAPRQAAYQTNGLRRSSRLSARWPQRPRESARRDSLALEEETPRGGSTTDSPGMTTTRSSTASAVDPDGELGIYPSRTQTSVQVSPQAHGALDDGGAQADEPTPGSTPRYATPPSTASSTPGPDPVLEPDVHPSTRARTDMSYEPGAPVHLDVSVSHSLTVNACEMGMRDMVDDIEARPNVDRARYGPPRLLPVDGPEEAGSFESSRISVSVDTLVHVNAEVERLPVASHIHFSATQPNSPAPAAFQENGGMYIEPVDEGSRQAPASRFCVGLLKCLLMVAAVLVDDQGHQRGLAFGCEWGASGGELARELALRSKLVGGRSASHCAPAPDETTTPPAILIVGRKPTTSLQQGTGVEEGRAFILKSPPNRFESLDMADDPGPNEVVLPGWHVKQGNAASEEGTANHATPKPRLACPSQEALATTPCPSRRRSSKAHPVEVSEVTPKRKRRRISSENPGGVAETETLEANAERHATEALTAVGVHPPTSADPTATNTAADPNAIAPRPKKARKKKPAPSPSSPQSRRAILAALSAPSLLRHIDFHSLACEIGLPVRAKLQAHWTAVMLPAMSNYVAEEVVSGMNLEVRRRIWSAVCDKSVLDKVDWKGVAKKTGLSVQAVREYFENEMRDELGRFVETT